MKAQRAMAGSDRDRNNTKINNIGIGRQSNNTNMSIARTI